MQTSLITKSTLREQALHARKSVTDKLQKEASIIKHLNIILPCTKIVASYMAMANEVDLKNFHTQHEHLALPRVTKNDASLSFHHYIMGDSLQKHSLGMQEPLATAPIVTPDIILVPIVGFDAHKNRLGYGGGYYDRTLATLPNAQKIGIAFACQELDAIPTNKHDIQMDSIVTEVEII